MTKTAEEIIVKIKRYRRVIEKHQLDIETNVARINACRKELLTKFGVEYE